MTRRLLSGCLALLACACVARRAVPVRYDLDGTSARTPSELRLNAVIGVTPIQAPSWLRTTALTYRLDYEVPARLRAYTQSQWTAPPGELLTLRLRERISAANDGLTLTRTSEDMDSYRLEVTLESFAQIFASPDRSECIVTLSASLSRPDNRVLAQKTFTAERPAPSANAAGAVAGLAAASDSDFEEILTWLRSTLLTQNSSTTRADPVSP